MYLLEKDGFEIAVKSKHKKARLLALGFKIKKNNKIKTLKEGS